MFTAYLERQIAAIMNKLIGHSFPEPEAMTPAMHNDLEIHVLREVGINLNGKVVSVSLAYCSCATPGQEYSVSGHSLDQKSHFAEFFPTLDEAEQQYIVYASYVHAAINMAKADLGAELLNLGAKLQLLA